MQATLKSFETAEDARLSGGRRAPLQWPVEPVDTVIGAPGLVYRGTALSHREGILGSDG
jgi:hypothetical protein